MSAPCGDLLIEAGWRADANNGCDRHVRAAQAASLADSPRQLRHRGTQPRAARTHLLAVGPDHGSGVCGVGLARGELARKIRRTGDVLLDATDRRGVAEPG